MVSFLLVSDTSRIAKSKSGASRDHAPDNDVGGEVSTIRHQLGLLAKTQGKLDEAKRLLMESLEGRRRLSGATHMDTKASLEALDNLAEMTSAITGP